MPADRAAPPGREDRLPPLPDDRLTAAQRAAVDAYAAARGTTGVEGPFVPLLRSPELLTRVRAVGDYVRYRSVLPPRLRELAILLIARHWTQQVEWSIHAPIARDAGLAPAIIAAIADGRRPDAMAADEAALHDFCAELLRTQGVSDPTYARLAAGVGEQGIVDTVGLLGYYQLLAMVMNTARTPPPDGAPPPLPPFPR